MTSVSVEGDKLRIGDTTKIVEAPIEKIVQIEDLVVALLERPGDDSPRDNIVAFDLDGCRLWKAEELEAPSGHANPYVNLWEEDGGLWAGSWKGWNYRLDPKTGDHKESIFVK